MTALLRSARLMLLISAATASRVQADCPVRFTGNINTGEFPLGRGEATALDNLLQPIETDAGFIQVNQRDVEFRVARTNPNDRPNGSARANLSISTAGSSFTMTAEASVSQAQPGHGGFFRALLSLNEFVLEHVGDLTVRITGTITTRVVDAFGVETQNVETIETADRFVRVRSILCRADTVGPGQGSVGVRSCTVTVRLNIEPPPANLPASFTWRNPSGGSYDAAANWEPDCGAPPRRDGQRSDTAVLSLPASALIPISSGSLATAGQWLVRGGTAVDFNGSGRMEFLEVSGSTLRVSGTASLETDSANVIENGRLEFVDSARWTNNSDARLFRGTIEFRSSGAASMRDLLIGTGLPDSGGPSTVRKMGGPAPLVVARTVTVGDTFPGTLEVLDGGSVKVDQPDSEPAAIGKAAAGTVTVRGLSAGNDPAALTVAKSLTIGEGAQGRLNIQNGGLVKVGALFVNGPHPTASGELVIDGQGNPLTLLTVNSRLFVRAAEILEVAVRNGGTVSTPELVLGSSQVRPGVADLTLDGLNSILEVIQLPSSEQPAQETLVGVDAPGQLSVRGGARAILSAGLLVGAGAQGTVILSAPGAASEQPTLSVTGETRVGQGAQGTIQIADNARMTSHGNMTIGLGAGSPSGSVTVGPFAFLTVNGRLSVGESGEGRVTADQGSFVTVNGILSVGTGKSGILNILDNSAAHCETLLVGGAASEALGIIVLGPEANLTISGNAQVGAAAGRGEILLSQSSSALTLGGRMDIGSPTGGGSGGVALVGATIDGAGSISVNPSGSLTGTGAINLCGGCRVDNGGTISPGLSPGTLTINGDYAQSESGVLVIEVAGTEPGQFDVLHVTGNATLAGTVDLRFIDGFVPQPGDNVDFVQVDGTITGKLTGGAFVESPGDPESGQPAAQAEVKWEVTPQGTCRLTVTNVTALDASGRVLPPECGAGLCGAGAVPLLPMTLLNLVGLRCVWRSRLSSGRARWVPGPHSDRLPRPRRS